MRILNVQIRIHLSLPAFLIELDTNNVINNTFQVCNTEVIIMICVNFRLQCHLTVELMLVAFLFVLCWTCLRLEVYDLSYCLLGLRVHRGGGVQLDRHSWPLELNPRPL